jgi:hypothetical protein
VGVEKQVATKNAQKAQKTVFEFCAYSSSAAASGALINQRPRNIISIGGFTP